MTSRRINVNIGHMPKLINPSVDFHDSFLSFWDELDAAGEEAHEWLNWGGDETNIELADRELFADWVERQISFANTPDDELPSGRVRASTLWWVEDGELLGKLSIRHELNDALFERGGHIGYIVRPSARRQGHATALLRAALPVAAELGVVSALVTVDDTNVASIKVIEYSGGILDDICHGTRRYWIPTRQRPRCSCW